MREIKHPLIDQVSIIDVLHALADPTRLEIVRQLSSGEALTCGQLIPDRPKSSMSHHFKILRETGLIETTPRGKEHFNLLRRSEIDERFPGVLESILSVKTENIL